MALAFIGSTTCQVHADRDLGDNWAVSLVPPNSVLAGGQPVVPLVVKLQAEDRDRAILGALEILQKAGKIDRFEAPLPPAPAPAAPAAPAATP
jgi:hypothetical protein